MVFNKMNIKKSFFRMTSLKCMNTLRIIFIVYASCEVKSVECDADIKVKSSILISGVELSSFWLKLNNTQRLLFSFLSHLTHVMNQ